MKSLIIKSFLIMVAFFVCANSPVIAQEDWDENISLWADKKTAKPFLHAKELSQEISILNLLNGLYLTENQMREIVKLSGRVRERIEDALKENYEHGKEFERALKELKKVLEDPEAVITESMQHKVHDTERRIKEAKHALKEDLKAFESELGCVLTPSQVEVIRTFNPCLIPPKDLRDPVRVGQAGGEYAELEMHMDHIRNLPSKPYCAVIDAILCKMIEEWDPHFHFSETEKDEELKRLRGIMDGAREMSDHEFVLMKNRLAQQVMKHFIDLEDKSIEITEFFAKMGSLDKPGKWLLNPRIIEILEKRLRHPNKYAARTRGCGANAQGCSETAMCSDGQNCADLADSDPTAGFCPCGKPTFGWFCAQFKIPPEEREACRVILAKGQIQLLNLLSGEMEDGRTPLAVMFVEPQQFESLLFQRIPGRNTTYLSEAQSIIIDLKGRLMERMDSKGANEFVKSDVDLYDVHVGNLNRFE